MKPALLLLLFLAVAMPALAQNTPVDPDIFNKITAAAKEYVPDTSAAPNDKLTRKIMEFRNLKGGFNINEAVLFKFQEEEAKATDAAAKEAVQKMKDAFFNGNAKHWLNNAIIHIYRTQFTYKEMRQLVKFYRTPAGQKMATQLPVIIVKSLAAAEMIQKSLQPSK